MVASIMRSNIEQNIGHFSLTTSFDKEQAIQYKRNMSSMLRSASMKVRVFAGTSARKVGGRSVRRHNIANVPCSVSQVRFLNDDGSGKPSSEFVGDQTIKRGSLFRFPPIPQPMPAVAFDYDDDWGDSDGDGSNGSNVSQMDLNLLHASDVTGDVDPISLVTGQQGRNLASGTNKPYPAPPTSVDRNGKPIAATRKAGGGGGGRHRCPKCGTYTIFSHNEFGNSFYCATCSGWFTAAETLEGDVSDAMLCGSC
jgi:hypothetical protein